MVSANFWKHYAAGAICLILALQCIQSASFDCSLSIVSSTGAVQEAQVDLACAAAGNVQPLPGEEPTVLYDAALNIRTMTGELSCTQAGDSRQLHRPDQAWDQYDIRPLLAGVNGTVADQPNTRGLLTFEGNCSLTFHRLSLQNIKLPTVSNPLNVAHSLDPQDVPSDRITSSIVWFETTGNVTIFDWSNDGTSAPIQAGFGTLMFNSSEDHIQDHIRIVDSDVVCAPFCFTMAGASKSLTFENSTFQSAFSTLDRHTFTLTTAVWANLTGILEVSNCQFNGFGTDYGSLSVFATNVTIVNCSFTDNVAQTAGAGLYITGQFGVNAQYRKHVQPQ